MFIALVAALATTFALAGIALADGGGRPFTTALSGAAEVPGPGDPDATGTSSLRLNRGSRRSAWTSAGRTSTARYSPTHPRGYGDRGRTRRRDALHRRVCGNRQRQRLRRGRPRADPRHHPQSRELPSTSTAGRTSPAALSAASWGRARRYPVGAAPACSHWPSGPSAGWGRTRVGRRFGMTPRALGRFSSCCAAPRLAGANSRGALSRPRLPASVRRAASSRLPSRISTSVSPGPTGSSSRDPERGQKPRPVAEISPLSSNVLDGPLPIHNERAPRAFLQSAQWQRPTCTGHCARCSGSAPQRHPPCVLPPPHVDGTKRRGGRAYSRRSRSQG